MRFEVNVDDGSGLAALHKARDKYNVGNAGKDGFTPADDMPTFVQRLTDQAVADALAGLGEPTTLSAALTRIAALQQENATLTQEVAAAAIAPAAVAIDTVAPTQPG